METSTLSKESSFEREKLMTSYLYTSKSGILVSFDYQVIGFYIYYPQDHVLPPSSFQNCQQVFLSCGSKGNRKTFISKQTYKQTNTSTPTKPSCNERLCCDLLQLHDLKKCNRMSIQVLKHS